MNFVRLKGRFHKYSTPFFLLLIVSFYLFNGIAYINSQSITSDEGSFYNYAVRYLKGNPERIAPRSDNSKMPVVALNTIPRIIENLVRPGMQKTDMGVSDMIRGRFVTLFFSVFILLLVFIWASQLYGKHAGLFATFLFSFCPNNMAAATLVTTDSYSVFFLMLSMYLLWRFCITGNTRDFILLSFVVASSQLVKQSLFHLYILVPFSLLVFFTVNRKVIKKIAWLKLTCLFFLINLFVLNAGYYFNHSFLKLGDYSFISNLFLSVQKIFPPSLPMPFPKPFVDGLDMAKFYDQIGGGLDKVSSFGKVTILGKNLTGESVWYYYFVSIFFKTPLTYFVFLAIALFNYFRQFKAFEFIRKEFFLLIPIVYFLVLMSFFYQTHCGIRHVIFIYPFLFVFMSSIVVDAKHYLMRLLILVLSVFLIISVFKYYRNYYPYTNELIRDKKNAYSYVGASNLDFMHGQLFFKKYLQENKNVRWATKQPEVGTFLIRVEDYMDIWNRHQYDWIVGFKPVGHVAHCGLLIKVSENDLKKAGFIK